MLKKEIFEENAILRCIVLHLILHITLTISIFEYDNQPEMDPNSG